MSADLGNTGLQPENIAGPNKETIGAPVAPLGPNPSAPDPITPIAPGAPLLPVVDAADQSPADDAAPPEVAPVDGSAAPATSS